METKINNNYDNLFEAINIYYKQGGRMMFWTCLNGCHDFVDWEHIDKINIATCRKCGASNQTVVILFRNSWNPNGELETSEEFEICQKYLPTFEFRSQLPENALVVGRHSVLPFFEELERELALKNSRLVNSHSQHKYIADITNYWEDLKEFTPKTYTQWGNLGEGQYIVKGKTNSKKFRWDTHMYVPSRDRLVQVISNLFIDQTIADQGIVVRDYIPLRRLGEGINGLPISAEWRCFCYKDKILATGFYWSNFEELSPGNLPQEGINFLKKITAIVSKKANFYVVDIAEKESGGFMVVELNCGMMSGLSCVDPNEMYGNLAKALAQQESK